ncbi:hypothetical protein BC628DRAFT_1344751 [Trametes gibbosa]|nr:hypothetical protein BC628DRAFT_1344751 [Trametes gibbosa]
MSSPTETVYGATSSADVSAVSNSPPIIHFARIAGHALALSFSYLSRFSATLASHLLVPFALAYVPIHYLLSPAIVLVQVLLELFVFAPYAILAAAVRNIYPIYVFVGVACICSAFLGYVARLISKGLTYAVYTPRPKVAVSADPPPDAAPANAVTSKMRVRKRVSYQEGR